MRPRIRIIYNPTAGKEIVKGKLHYILDVLEESGLEASAFATKGAGDATRAAAFAVDEGFDYLVVCGGDGTVNEVVNGLARKDRRPPLGIIPAGTTNDLARALGIPTQIEEAALTVARRFAIQFDLGQIGEDRYFVNIAACGKLTEITYDVPSKMKTMLGYLAYYMKGLELLPRLRPIHLHVESDARRFDGKVMLCLITNSRHVAGFRDVAPSALVNDGLFDVILVKRTNIGELIRLVSAALRGEHLEDERVVYFQASELHLSSKERVDLNIDGEYGGKLPHSIRIKSSHLSVIVPEEELSNGEEDERE